MKMEADLFSQLFKALWHSNQNLEPNRLTAGHEKVSDLLDYVSTRFVRIENERALEWLLPANNRLQVNFGNRYIFLKPVERGRVMLPIIWMKCDFTYQQVPKISLKLCLFLFDETKKIKALAYRFETPEGEGTGTHDYYHAQLITSFVSGNGVWCPNCRKWLPETQPAFAIDAQDPVTLLICLLVSLYGINEVGKLLKTVSFKHEIKSFFGKMSCKSVQEHILKEKKKENEIKTNKKPANRRARKSNRRSG